MSADIAFTKENLDACLSRLAKEFRKLNGRKMPAEIILIGGAAVLANYGFRDMTYDIDAIIQVSSAMTDAINIVGDEMGLPNGWLNSDFMRTKSYSPKLLQHSVYYKRFGYVLEVRTISGEYLVAMKLMSGRQYKNDISDIIGILHEERERGKPLSLESIKKAVCDIYDEWENLPQDSRDLITEIMRGNKFDELYEQYRNQERAAKEALVNFEKDYPGIVNEDNVNSIVESLRKHNGKS